MRACLVLFALIAATVALGASYEFRKAAGHTAPASESSVEDAWVRTVDGWERSSTLRVQQIFTPKTLHPFTVAGFQILASLFALFAFERNVSESPGSRA